MYDAILAAVPMFAARTRQRAAVLVISDGADTASDAGIKEIRTALLSDAFVYAVAVDSPDGRAINTRVNPAALRDITDTSGGRTEVVRTSEDITVALASIAEELNSRYRPRLHVASRRRRQVSQHQGEGVRRVVPRQSARRLHRWDGSRRERGANGVNGSQHGDTKTRRETVDDQRGHGRLRRPSVTSGSSRRKHATRIRVFPSGCFSTSRPRSGLAALVLRCSVSPCEIRSSDTSVVSLI